jgi:hypothetical protein
VRPGASLGGGSELQLDLRGGENESNKFDSGGRYLDSVAAYVNRAAVKSNQGRVWVPINMPGTGEKRER